MLKVKVCPLLNNVRIFDLILNLNFLFLKDIIILRKNCKTNE